MSDDKDTMGEGQAISQKDVDRARAKAGWPVADSDADGKVAMPGIPPEAKMTPVVPIGEISGVDNAIHPGTTGQADLVDKLKAALEDQKK